MSGWFATQCLYFERARCTYKVLLSSICRCCVCTKLFACSFDQFQTAQHRMYLFYRHSLCVNITNAQRKGLLYRSEHSIHSGGHLHWALAHSRPSWTIQIDRQNSIIKRGRRCAYMNMSDHPIYRLAYILSLPTTSRIYQHTLYASIWVCVLHESVCGQSSNLV